ncbi:aminopeptidase Q-like isoform X2 [Drosophila tropicalis]|uniref:aminopeptidase Q-like isoform X2 n=1 Tax=Drosophila tropicalis TaxID=46794 RepID=UPI0035AC20B2
MRLTKNVTEVFNGLNGIFFCLIVILGNTAVAVKLYDEPRLPLTLIPYHYDLKLLTYLEDSPDMFRYMGSVNISVHAQQSTNLVVLHARDANIEVQKIQIWDKEKGVLFNTSRTEYNKEKDYFIIEVEMPFVRGRSYVLSLPFENILKEDFKSGYFVGYNEGKNELDRSWFSLTQFERNYIRNVLPSFDEPALRATFNVTLGHHKRFQSFSNMPLLKRFNSDLKDYVWSMHEISPLMPTYLLAFSINNFTCMFSKTFDREPVGFRTCSHVTQVQALSLASVIAPKLFQFFENLFQVPCPLREIQQLAIPNLPIAAMENWGLVVYSDEMIMQKNKKKLTNLSQGQIKTLQLVSHELVHMWFGNLVTISWWDSLWLNEGLAGYFEAAGVEHLQMNWGRNILFKYREGSLMNELMAMPVAINASSDKDLIENSSVAYVYQKVTTILRMLNAMLGDEVFYEGLYFYLSQYSYSNTTPDQFWGKMQLASLRSGVLPDDHKVNIIMDSWTNQAGYPVLDVIRNYNNNTIFFAQNHFSSSNGSHSEVWWIPLTYTTQSERNFSSTRTKVWLIQPSMHLNIPLLSKEWVMFNIQAVGYYRVNYDERNWRLIAFDLYENHKQIHVLNRAQIVSDCLYLWQQGRIHWYTAVDVLKYIIEEDEYEPLVAFVVGVTNGFWGISPDRSLIIAKWLGSAGKWYAEFINYTFNWFVLIETNHFSRSKGNGSKRTSNLKQETESWGKPQNNGRQGNRHQ